MPKVIQVRGVPDDVHAKLVDAAKRAGKSLTEFVNDELADVAHRVDPVEHNRRVIEKLRAEIGVIDIPAEETLRALHEGREERVDWLVNTTKRRGA